MINRTVPSRGFFRSGMGKVYYIRHRYLFEARYTCALEYLNYIYPLISGRCSSLFAKRKFPMDTRRILHFV